MKTLSILFSSTKVRAIPDGRKAQTRRGFGWDVNPWVRDYTFKRVDKPAGWPK